MNILEMMNMNGISACAPDISNPLNETFKYQDTELKEFCAGLWTKVKSY